MTDPGPSPSPEPAAEASTLASRLAVKQRAGGIAVPIATVLLAFFMGGVVVCNNVCERLYAAVSTTFVVG